MGRHWASSLSSISAGYRGLRESADFSLCMSTNRRRDSQRSGALIITKESTNNSPSEKVPSMPLASVVYSRVNFQEFAIQQPSTTDHHCIEDKLIIGIFYYRLKDVFPHIFTVYVNMVLGSSSPLILEVVTSASAFQRLFSIKIIQIQCPSFSQGKMQKLG